MARAQESVEGDSFMRAFQSVAGLAQAQQSPEVFDVIDMDATTKFLFKTYGAPLNLLKKDQEVKAIREQRAQQQAQAQQ
ncbi:portal protein, partial [Lactococcus petauri]